MNVLKKHSWPGNIRELENVIEHAFVLENSNLITIASLPEALLIATGTSLVEVTPAEQATQVASAGIVKAAAAHAGLDDEETGSSDIDSEDLDGEEIVPYSGESLDFNAQKEAFEKEFIIKALKTFRGRINQTALHANIPKKTLLRKIEKYGIIAKDYSV